MSEDSTISEGPTPSSLQQRLDSFVNVLFGGSWSATILYAILIIAIQGKNESTPEEVVLMQSLLELMMQFSIAITLLYIFYKITIWIKNRN